jgi:hypothetical protein
MKMSNIEIVIVLFGIMMLTFIFIVLVNSVTGFKDVARTSESNQAGNPSCEYCHGTGQCYSGMKCEGAGYEAIHSECSCVNKKTN